MSCLTKSVVYQIALGEVIAFPIKFPDLNLLADNVSLQGKIVGPNDIFVANVQFQIMDQIINKGTALMRFDSRNWSDSLMGNVLKFDVILTINNTVQPVTSYTSGVMYLEVVDSPTRRFLGLS